MKEDLIWEKDVAIPLRDGVELRSDVFRPARLQGKPLPALLAWSPYGKTGAGEWLCISCVYNLHRVLIVFNRTSSNHQFHMVGRKAGDAERVGEV